MSENARQRWGSDSSSKANMTSTGGYLADADFLGRTALLHDSSFRVTVSPPKPCPYKINIGEIGVNTPVIAPPPPH